MPSPISEEPAEGLVREFAAQSELVAQYGCPLGSLCSELDKRVTGPGLAAAELMRLPIEWAEEQFRSLGRRDAHDLALDLLAAYEGSALLANTLRDPNVLSGRHVASIVGSTRCNGTNRTRSARRRPPGRLLSG